MTAYENLKKFIQALAAAHALQTIFDMCMGSEETIRRWEIIFLLLLSLKQIELYLVLFIPFPHPTHSPHCY